MMDARYEFRGRVSKEVLCRYLARAVTVSLDSEDIAPTADTSHIESFILNTGAKYICRAATCWSPQLWDYTTRDWQKRLIDRVHERDPYVVFEACVFECISTKIDQIPVPAEVFEAFGMPVEERSFSFEAMCFPDGSYRNMWGENTAVPDITQQETMLFFYHRAAQYIDLGYEGLHMGQVHLIGRNDKGWERWTALLAMIRKYAEEHARRGFVFLNAHTHGIIGADGVLLFDFHMYPSRPMAVGTRAHFPTEDDPQQAEFKSGHSDSIYGKSRGGRTYSGWECRTLPYLVELDNFGCDTENLHVPRPADMRVWGMDEITWYALQPRSYRARFLKYAYNWVMNQAQGDGYFAMPGQRCAYIYDETGKVTARRYYAYDPRNYAAGWGDEAIIKEIWGEEFALKPVCIFDFGNVLVRFDPAYMTGLYIKDPEDARLVRQIMFDRLYWNRLDEGTIVDSEVKRLACKRIPKRLHEVARCVYDHWYEHLPEIEGMRQLLHDLKAAGKRLYLLSNISVDFEYNYHRLPALHSLLSVFDGCVFSGSIGLVKPFGGIYQHLLDKYDLRPEDCVFIDDSILNVGGARMAGIGSICFDGDVAALRAQLLPDGDTSAI